MAANQKLKEIPGLLSVIGSDGAEQRIGEITLCPTYSDDQGVWASGQLVSGTLGVVGTLNVKNVPLACWPKANPVGAPKQDEKHLQVLLAWALYLGRYGDKRGLADDAVAKEFNYSEGKKVREIRMKQAKNRGINLNDILLLTNDSSISGCIEAGALIESPAWQKLDDGSIKVAGHGFLWSDKLESRFIKGEMIATGKAPAPGFDLDTWKAKKGPVIISFIEPAR